MKKGGSKSPPTPQTKAKDWGNAAYKRKKVWERRGRIATLARKGAKTIPKIEGGKSHHHKGEQNDQNQPHH